MHFAMLLFLLRKPQVSFVTVRLRNLGRNCEQQSVQIQ